MDSYSEEIWKERIRDKINVDEIKDLKSFESELEKLKSNYPKYQKQTQTLIDNKELFVEGSESLQEDMYKNISDEMDSLGYDDVEGLRRLKPYNIKEKQEREGLLYNAILNRMRGLRSINDIGGLRGLRENTSDISELPSSDRNELISEINRVIGRLEE